MVIYTFPPNRQTIDSDFSQFFFLLSLIVQFVPQISPLPPLQSGFFFSTTSLMAPNLHTKCFLVENQTKICFFPRLLLTFLYPPMIEVEKKISNHQQNKRCWGEVNRKRSQQAGKNRNFWDWIFSSVGFSRSLLRSSFGFFFVCGFVLNVFELELCLVWCLKCICFERFSRHC